VTSADGTVLVAESVGDPAKPAIVCCHGFANTALVFEPVFQDESLLCEFNLVSTTHRTGNVPL
jgi:pimeloyl-ACP methyl ester carboxylesterase